MQISATLADRWQGLDRPFLIDGDRSLDVFQVLDLAAPHLTDVRAGEVVALVGDFNARSIADLLTLIDRKAIIVPLSKATRPEHGYSFGTAQVEWYVEDGAATRMNQRASHVLLGELRAKGYPGLVLFSTGTTGRPKAILHDLTAFLRRFDTPRPSLRTLSFLQFDHIGGLNTLLHTLFNTGVVVVPRDRSVQGVLDTCSAHGVELLPTTPTFLRMLLLSGRVPDGVPTSLRIVTYGTERMDQGTLDALCDLLPSVDFRQTYGLSELGIVRATSKDRRSLMVRLGGEGVETRIVNDVLEIRSESRMLGYLNARSPFDADGWYNTGDVVRQEQGFLQIVGRTNDVINVAGLKFMASDVERVVHGFPGVALAKVEARSNPLTGQHVEVTVEPEDGVSFDEPGLRRHLAASLPTHMQPRRIRIGEVPVGHRFKRL